MMATSGVGNTGIDLSDIQCVIQIDFPSSLMNMIQELGQTARAINSSPYDYYYKLYFNLEQFLYVFERIHDPDEKQLDKTYKKQELEDLMEIELLLGNPEKSRITKALVRCVLAAGGSLSLK
eukprot:11527086-Ditylum_brightwellii.AAC.1